MKGFIKVTTISHDVGNPKFESYLRVREISRLSEAKAEHAGIGGATWIDMIQGTFLVAETMEELIPLVETAIMETEPR